MSKKRVYDLPTRLFHWLFAALFLMAYAIGSTIDDESVFFMYHMLIGLVLFGLVAFRFVWGIIGSKYARFSSFNLSARSLLNYLKSFFCGENKPELGHNAASSFSAIVMMGLIVGLAFTGIQMTLGHNPHFYEEVHEFLVNSMILVVVAHVFGVLIHSIRYKDKLATSMITGNKYIESSQKGIEKNHGFAAVILIVYILGLTLSLSRNFDSNAGTLNLLGLKLQLAEKESEKNLEYNEMDDYELEYEKNELFEDDD